MAPRAGARTRRGDRSISHFAIGKCPLLTQNEFTSANGNDFVALLVSIRSCLVYDYRASRAAPAWYFEVFFALLLTSYPSFVVGGGVGGLVCLQ